MKQEMVSVIVPVYNTEKYIARCLESIITQKYRNIEIIVVNDGSTDQSEKIINTYAEKDRRVQLYNQKNAGQAVARNRGLQIANGEYILMVDSDDSISENLIDDVLRKMCEAKADLAIFDLYYFKSGKKIYFKTGTNLRSAETMPLNKMYKRSLWEGQSFPENFWYEDLGVIPVVVAKAKKIIKVNKPYYLYTADRGDSQTNIVDYKKILDTIPMCNQVRDKLIKEGLYEKNEYFVEQLYIEHLLINTVTRKISQVKNKKHKIYVVEAVLECIKENFPDWKKNNYKCGSFFQNLIMRAS
ncbi:MAG: glycosyl transferase family protein, partial [Neobacillus sp.]|nr:glycosyl transferase family protein [Neobacillus sp.]